MKSTKDIWLVIYLKQQGILPSTVEKVSRGMGKFQYDIEDKEWAEFKLWFVGSDVNRTKQDMSSIKDLLY